MKSIVIVESPAKCKTIEKYLGKNYKVLASYGHIRDLPSKDGSVLPDKNFEMKYVVDARSKKYVKEISDAVKKADELILATDPDREGESISWHVYDELLKEKVITNKFPVKRVSFNSITKDAVNKAMAAPREIDMNLVNSQQARRALDYLVGFTLSPVLWRKLPGSRSAGRVQSVALRLVCEREKEIEAFKPVEYWTIQALFQTDMGEQFLSNLSQISGKRIDKLGIKNKAEAEQILNEILGQEFSVKEIEKKRLTRNPKPPFTTSTLQQEASRKLGFSAKKTMQIAQKLYEGVTIGGETAGLITYMRTDGVSIAPEAMDRTREAISKLFKGNYLPEKPRFYSSKAKNAQEAHEAIRPTDSMRTPDSVEKYLDSDQAKLYELIWKRLVASQMEAALLDQVAADIETNSKKYIFRSVGTTMVFDGFYKLYKEDVDDSDDEDAELKLPILTENQNLDLAKTEEKQNPEGEQHFTQPPPRYNEASLVKKLEELGIGRPSTYASILAVLIDREYVKLDKRRFIPETRGRLVTEFLSDYFTKYVEYDFTAELEEELDLISDGKLDWKKALKDFWGAFKENIDKAMELKITDVINTLDTSLENLFFGEHGTAEEKRKCPKCSDGKIGLRLGKFGAFIGCSNYPTCDYTRQILTNDNKPKESEEGGDAGADANAPNNHFETRVLGNDKRTGKEITLRKGPYGFYVQLGEQGKDKKDKPKRTSIPRGVKIDDVDLQKAETMLALPRNLGKHPADGLDVLAGVGRFGPYISHNKKFFSLKNISIFDVTLEDAVPLIVEKPEGARRGGFKKKTDTEKKEAPKKTTAKKSAKKK
ncbi:MAG TPA: type I DNA topoisomerase [Alphaproteobacteria bacterium]|nr:type I DNA topoisomerase [Alphaproteobacteria bacterium]